MDADTVETAPSPCQGSSHRAKVAVSVIWQNQVDLVYKSSAHAIPVYFRFKEWGGADPGSNKGGSVLTTLKY